MSHLGTIFTIHRAEVRIPENVWQRFGHTKEYETFSLFTGGDVGSSGQDRYSEVTEWAEDVNYEACVEFVNRWHNRIIQWEAEIRSGA